jgi:fructokinase
MAWDVVCLGEVMIDLVPHTKVDGQWLYAPNPGGAPGNVAVGLARLGHRVVMLSKVGDEAFGDLVVAALRRHGVDTSGVTRAVSEKTGLSVVTLAPDGDRDFIFYRDNAADLLVGVDDVKPELIEHSRLLHVGVLPMSTARTGAAQRKAIRLAQDAGRLISADPNFRPALWTDRSAMLRAGRELVAEADIVKLSEGELFDLTEEGSIEEAARSLWHDGLLVLAVTKGAQGAELFTSSERFACDGFVVDAIDTTGAGDAFVASLLSGLLEPAMDFGDHDRLSHILRSACAAGAIATTKKGAMETLPGRETLSRFLDERRESAPVA